ncbi:MAG: class I SAM-dependent methyltransferase [Gammaproteobacteria bacterium]|nr:class I SAM-dependent methyltransferase [Pseudomonadales bacterium]MCP5348522.1 class I SAM-dependent methyltransferase [Pseudomonadales bacterium]
MNNDPIIEAWNTVLFEKFTRFKHLLVEGLSAHSDELLGREIHHQGAWVLDVGCGFGDSSQQLAARVGKTGRVVGVDCAANFIASAAEDARQSNQDNLDFLVADVEREDLGGPYDFAFSRFGTMFFNLPGAAMRNIGRSLKEGGRLDMIVWRKREDNPWLHDAELCVREIVPVVSHEETDQVHCGPGPFSMAGPDMVSDMLHGTGFRSVSFERFDADICIGRDIEEAVEFAMALGPAGEIIRLAGEQGEKLREPVKVALADTLAKYLCDDGVWGPSSTWFVSAIRA